MADSVKQALYIAGDKRSPYDYPTKNAKVNISGSGKTIYTYLHPEYSTRNTSKNPSKEVYSDGSSLKLISDDPVKSSERTTVDGITTVKDKYYYPFTTSERLENGNIVTWVKVQATNASGVPVDRWAIYDITDKSGNVVSSYITAYGSTTDSTVKNTTTNIGSVYQQTAANAPDDAQNVSDSVLFTGGYVPDSTTIGLFDVTWNQSTSGTEFFDIRSVLGVFGLPYQFLPIADPRVADGTDDAHYNDINYKSGYGDTRGVGAKYAEYIVEQMPILFMAPGKPAFMGTYNTEEKGNILETLIKQAGNAINSVGLDELLENVGKYYVFEYDVAEYYKYVNPMCRIASAYMNVATYTLDGTALQNLNWMNYTMSKLSGIFGSQDRNILNYVSIPFYIESETQITDSFGNSTTDSALAGTVNTISDTARELQFILGNVGSAADIDKIVSDADVTANAENLQQTIDNLLGGGNNFLGNIKNHLVSIATGGKMIFPKIWSGSDFSRSYNITVKLRSPDMDNLSLYFNIIVPTLHLVGFVAPHMLENDPNAYGNPFLVRAIYKGFFNIDMGIITSMDINRGDESRWNANGIPTVVDVSFTITDLYEVMSITKTDSTSFKYDTLNNTTQMDYIANFCGVNIYKPEIGRTISMWFVNNFANRARDYVSINIWGNIQQSVAQAITNIFVH